MNWELIAWCVGVAAAVWAFGWWLLVGSARMHWRQSCDEVAARRNWERSYRAPPRPPK